VVCCAVDGTKPSNIFLCASRLMIGKPHRTLPRPIGTISVKTTCSTEYAACRAYHLPTACTTFFLSNQSVLRGWIGSAKLVLLEYAIIATTCTCHGQPGVTMSNLVRFYRARFQAVGKLKSSVLGQHLHLNRPRHSLSKERYQKPSISVGDYDQSPVSVSSAEHQSTCY